MPYIGNTPVPQATQTRDRFVATSGQTSFATSGYTPNFIDVYLDGVKLDQDEYTATNGSDVVLDSGATTGQILEVVAFSSFDVADIRNMTQPLGLKGYTTTERNALTPISAGDTIYNSTTGSIEFYDGANWIATNLIPTINSVTGTIYSGASSTLTLSLTNATDAVTVRFSEGGATVADVANVTVTSGSASVSVPAAVYGQTVGDTISVSILNQDGTPSSNGISKTVAATPTGGTITVANGYRVHTFNSSGSFSVPSGLSVTADILVVAGGGGAAGTYRDGSGGVGGGGGGAGGMLTLATQAITSGSYTVTVGAGGGGGPYSAGSSGTGDGSNGGNSQFGSLTAAIGGGAGGARFGQNNGTGYSGGSGGASSGDTGGAGGSGTAGQGNAGDQSVGGTRSSGGGGGAGGAAPQHANPHGGAGGVGAPNSYQTGSPQYYAGGGGGGGTTAGGNGNGGAGGSGGGGNGGAYNGTTTPQSGAANTGGGGGTWGAGTTPTSQPSVSGAGGSGVVIVRYQL